MERGSGREEEGKPGRKGNGKRGKSCKEKLELATATGEG